MNNAWEIPVIVSTDRQLLEYKELFDTSYHIKEQQFDGEISKAKANALLVEVQKSLNDMVYELYGLTKEEIAVVEGKK